MAASAVHCQRGGRNPRRNKNGYPKPICVSVSSNVKYVWGLCRERRKIPSAINRSDRHSACPNILPNVAPLHRRLEIEEGSPTPTRKENPGWMVSCSEQRAQST